MRRDIFQAIADPVRRKIMETIGSDVLSVNEVAKHFEISRQAVSKQLKILDECGLVKVKNEGRERLYSIDPQSLIPASLWIDSMQRQWEERIDSFEQYVNKLNRKDDEK